VAGIASAGLFDSADAHRRADLKLGEANVRGC
jgi:hypothetical protein